MTMEITLFGVKFKKQPGILGRLGLMFKCSPSDTWLYCTFMKIAYLCMQLAILFAVVLFAVVAFVWLKKGGSISRVIADINR